MNKLYILLTLILFGCSTSKFSTPKMETPPKFIEAKTQTAALEDLKEWWRSFHDPVLNEIIEEAVAQNFDLRIEMERIEEARASYQSARSQLFPVVDLTADGLREKISKNTLPAVTSPLLFNLFRLGFDSLWEIDIFGKNALLKEAAYHDLEAQIEFTRFVKIIIIAEAARIYVDIRNSQQQLELSKKTLASQAIVSSLTGQRYDSGLTNNQAVMAATSSEEDIKSTIALLERDIKQSIFQLASLLGQTPESLYNKLSKVKPIPIAQAKLPPLIPSEVLKKRPDVKQAEKILQAAFCRKQSAIAGFFPNFFLRNQAHKESLKTTNLMQEDSNAFQVEGNFSLNILDFGRQRSQLNFENSLQKQAYLQYEKTVIDVLTEVESAFIAYYKEEERNKDLFDKANLQESTKVLEEDLYKSGLTDFATVLAFYQAYYTAEKDYLDSSRALMENLIAIYKALGGEWTCSALP